MIEFNEVNIETKISPLILASYLGRCDCVKMLLDNPNIDIDLASEDSGYTPLCMACLTGFFEIVKLLIEAEAEVNKPTKLNETAFKLCFNRLNEVTNLFENRKICFKMAELLLDYGVDINWIIDKNKGQTLLMKFCGLKMELSIREIVVNLEVIKFLLEHGADKKILSFKNKNAFDMANRHPNCEKVIELLKTTNQIYSQNNMKLKQSKVFIDMKKTQNALDSSRYSKH